MTDAGRIAELERQVSRLKERMEQLAVLAVQVTQVQADIARVAADTKDSFEKVEERFDKVDEDQRTTRRTLIGFAFSVALACIVALLAVVSGGVPR